MRPTVLALALLVLTGAASALAPARPPSADFHWSPDVPVAGDNVTFTSTSTDPDGVILLYRWLIEDDERLELFEHTASHTFARRGVYTVTHEVTDATLATSRIVRSVTVANTPPVPDFALEPSPTYRGAPVSLLGSASDADGDAIVSWSWELGDGAFASGRNVTHVYGSLGARVVTLTVLDEAFAEATVSRTVQVLNAPPHVVAHHSPQHPVAGQVVAFDATGLDPDGPSDLLTYRWEFSDGVVIEGAHAERVFVAGDHTAVVRAKDVDGGLSAPVVLAVRVGT